VIDILENERKLKLENENGGKHLRKKIVLLKSENNIQRFQKILR
jgi:hypothetical protein